MTTEPNSAEQNPMRRTWSEFRDARRELTTLLGVPVPFVGRRAEVEALYNIVRESLNKRQMGAAWVYGPSGVGKTRLLNELERAVSPDRRGVGWYRVVVGKELAGPPTLAGRLLLELLGGPHVLRMPDPWQFVKERLSAVVGAQAAECMEAVAPLLGLRGQEGSEEEEALRQREAPHHVAVQFVGSLLRHRGKQGPFVLQVDASYHDDEELQILLSGLCDTLAHSPATLLVEARRPPPEGVAIRAWRVDPLDVESMQALAKHLSKRVRGAPADLSEQLQAEADGNPERMIDKMRGMIAAGEVVSTDGAWTFRDQAPRVEAPARRTPATGTSGNTLPDRIARLPNDLHEVIDAAAIFGPVTWFGGILSVLRGGRHEPSESLSERDRVSLKASMMQLQAIDVLVFVENPKMTRELEFAFAFPTDPAAILAEMPYEKRSLYARLAAQWLGSRPRQDPVGDTARIAELYEQGGRNRQAAALYMEAGNAARTVGQLQRALALYDSGARTAGPDDADLACDVRTAHGGSLLRLSRHREAEPVLLDALHMARCLDDDLRCGIVQLRVAQVARVSGRYEAATSFLEGALKHLRVAGAHRWIADVSDELGVITLVRGEPDAYKNALAHFLKALALRRRSEDRRVVARSLCNIARVHMGRGHFTDAVEAVHEAVQICEQIQDRWGAAAARTVQGEVLAASGKHKQALQSWEVATGLASEIGDPSRRVELVVLQAEVHIALGDWQHAAALMLDALEQAREINDPELLSGIHRVQAAISLERDALETADLDSERAVQVARDSGARLQVARALLVRGCVLGTRAMADKGARATVTDRKSTECFEEGLNILREVGDIVGLAVGLRSYLSYLTRRGGGPRHSAVQHRLREVEAEIARVAG
ncbi:MAG: AAA family ATPase [Myxococcota bacterium]